MNKVDREEWSRNYFGSVVKEAVKDLKRGKEAYVFNLEQVKAVKDVIVKSIKLNFSIKDVEIIEDDGFFYMRVNKKVLYEV